MGDTRKEYTSPMFRIILCIIWMSLCRACVWSVLQEANSGFKA